MLHKYSRQILGKRNDNLHIFKAGQIQRLVPALHAGKWNIIGLLHFIVQVYGEIVLGLSNSQGLILGVLMAIPK